MSWWSRERPVKASIAHPPTIHHGRGDTGQQIGDTRRGERRPRPVPAVPTPLVVVERPNSVHPHILAPATPSNPYTPSMRPTDRRRLVILAEGEFGPHSAKTAYGVIRYGRDDVVAVHRFDEGGPERGRVPARPRHPDRGHPRGGARPPEPPDALLIGIAPTGGRLPGHVAPDHPGRHRRGSRRPVGPPHVHRRRPRVRGRRGRARDRDRRLPASARSDGDRRRAPPRARQAGDPDGRHRLRGRQDVGRARAPARGARRRQTRLVRRRPARPG